MTALLPSPDLLPSPTLLLGRPPVPGRPRVSLTTERLFDSMKKGATSETDDADHAWVTLLLLDSVGRQVDNVAFAVSDSDDGPGWSQVLDVNRAPAWALPWLGQFVGVRVPPGVDEDTARTMVRDEAAFGRGTRQAIINAAKRFLRPGHDVQIAERDTDAFHLTVTVFSNWLIGATYAELTAAYPTYTDLTAAFPTYDMYAADVAGFTAAMLATKPIRLVMDVQVVDNTPYSYLTSHWATYTDLAAQFPTYDLMTDYTP